MATKRIQAQRAEMERIERRKAEAAKRRPCTGRAGALKGDGPQPDAASEAGELNPLPEDTSEG